MSLLFLFLFVRVYADICWTAPSYNHEDDEKDMNELVEKLRSPMNAQSQELKRYMVETIFPVVQRVKEVHETLEEDGESSQRQIAGVNCR